MSVIRGGRGPALAAAALCALVAASCDKPPDEAPPVRPVLSVVVEQVDDPPF